MREIQIISMQIIPIFFLAFCCSALISPSPPEDMTSPSWAPDGKRLVYECYLEGPTEGGECSFTEWLVEPPDFCQAYYRPEAADICIMDIDKGQRIRLTQDPGGDWRPIWSPDGSQIAYKRQD